MLGKALVGGSASLSQNAANSIVGSVITTIGNSGSICEGKIVGQKPMVILPQTTFVNASVVETCKPLGLPGKLQAVPSTSKTVGSIVSKQSYANVTRFKTITPKLNPQSFRPTAVNLGPGPSTAPARLDGDSGFLSNQSGCKSDVGNDTVGNVLNNRLTSSTVNWPAYQACDTNSLKSAADSNAQFNLERNLIGTDFARLNTNNASTNMELGQMRRQSEVSYGVDEEETDVPQEVKLNNLRKALAPLVRGGDQSDMTKTIPVGFSDTIANKMATVLRKPCEFTPIQGGHYPQARSATANTSANASPFTSPQMTPILSRSRHNSGQSSTYLTPRSTPFNPEDNLHLGASAISTGSATPFASPLTTPYARSRHSSSQNHRISGCQLGQLNPGSTISGSRSRHSSGARRHPYQVPEDHSQHHSNPTHHQRVQQRRLRNSSGGASIPHSAPLSPLIDGQEFYVPNHTNQIPDGTSDYRRRHTSAGPLMHNYTNPAPLTQNQRLTILSNQQNVAPSCRPVPQLQLNTVTENTDANRPQSVPLPDILCNQQYSSVPNTPLLHHNQYSQQPCDNIALGINTQHNMRHFSFDSSVPPSSAPTPVPSEFADFEGMPDLESFDALQTLEPMPESTPPTVSPFTDGSVFSDVSRQAIGQSNNNNTLHVCHSFAGQVDPNNQMNQGFYSGSTEQMQSQNFLGSSENFQNTVPVDSSENTSNPYISANNYNSGIDNSNKNMISFNKNTLAATMDSTNNNNNNCRNTADNFSFANNRTPPSASISNHNVFSPPSMHPIASSSATEITLNALNTDTSTVQSGALGYNSVISDFPDSTAGFGSLDDMFQDHLAGQDLTDQDISNLVLDAS